MGGGRRERSFDAWLPRGYEGRSEAGPYRSLPGRERARRATAEDKGRPPAPALVEDWLFQAGGKPDAKRAVQEIGWARELGGYKLSVHSGSDKFSVYPILAEATRGAIHLKTAGTSYLEALRAVAEADIDLFREIAAVARACYDADRRTYHVSGSASDVPEPGGIAADGACALLDHVGARQVFHVTYGSVLDAAAPGGGTLGDGIKRCLDANEELHWAVVGRHIERHLAPFARMS